MNLFQYGEDSTSDSEGEKAQKGVEAVITRSSFCWVSSVEKETMPVKKEVPIEKSAEQPKAVEQSTANSSIVRKRQAVAEARTGEEKEAKIPKREEKVLPDPEEAKHWMAVLDPNTKKYYYWNQVPLPNALHV